MIRTAARPDQVSSRKQDTDLVEDLKDLRLGALWKFAVSQPASYWFTLAYLVVEYFRPQTRFPAVDVLPWGQATVGLAFLALLAEGRLPKPRTAAGFLIVAFSGVVLASAVFAYRPDIAFDQLQIYLGWLLIFLVITNVVTNEGRFLVFLLLFLVLSFRFGQFAARNWILGGFSFSVFYGPAGWFANPGEMGVQLCIFFVLSAAFWWALRKRWSWWKRVLFGLFPATAFLGVIATNSRGAQLALAVVLVWWVVAVARSLRGLLFMALVTAIGFFLIPESQMERWETAGDDATSETRQERFADGLEMMSEHPFVGIGYANWLPYYATFYTHRERRGLSHNIFIEAGAELGYTGLILFILLIAATLHLNRQTRKLARGPPLEDRFLYFMAHGLDGALVAFVAAGYFVTILYYPYFWINLAMTVSLNVATRAKLRSRQMRTVTEAPANRHPIRVGFGTLGTHGETVGSHVERLGP